MDTVTAIIALLKELGTPAITVIGFAWVIFKLNASKKDMSALESKVSSDIAKLESKVSSDIAGLKTELKADISGLESKVSGLELKVSALAVDVKSIKGNHLPHIEAAIKELAKGTPNEEHVKAILDLSREVELRTENSE
jgi:uncharacterized protein HemX